MRRCLVGVLIGALVLLVLGCSGSGSSSKSAVTTTVPASIANDGIDRANTVIAKLQKAGMPIGPTVPHPADDPLFQQFDGLLGKVDFHDNRLLSSSSEIDELVDGGSVEVFRDERAAIAASKDRGGYVFVKGAVLLHLTGELDPAWVIAYRDALNAGT